MNVSPLPVAGSTAVALDNDFDAVLRFEGPHEGGRPRGWDGWALETVHADSNVVHSGRFAARLERDAGSPSGSSGIRKRLPIDFDGEWVELRGFLRTEDVSEFAGLWMREDGPAGMLRVDTMWDQGLRGTTGWTEYSVRLPLDPRARELLFGVMLVGPGKVWADDLQLFVDGKPVAEAPLRVAVPTIHDIDQEFDADSGIHVTSLSERQIDDLTILGRVWGFLKYHHPRVAAGELHWDYELFRVMPALLTAAERGTRNHTLTHWLDQIGVPERCDPCADPPRDAHLLPDLDWIADAEQLGPELAWQLRQVHAYRFAGEEQFYVSKAHTIGNPLFDRELLYANHRPPDAGYRILALFRLWNIIAYWFPYRDLLDDDWPAVLRAFLPRFAAAESWDQYRLELLAFITCIQDTHARLLQAYDVRPPRGGCYWPVALRFIEGRPTVIALTGKADGPGYGLEIGDVLKAVDGEPVESLVQRWSPYYSASNQAARLLEIARYLPRGECGVSTLTIERRGEAQIVVVPRLPGSDPVPLPHDRPGETFQALSPEVAYLKLSSIRAKEIPGYIEQASGTRGLVIDIRGYPSEFVVFALGSRLVREPVPFARHAKCDLSNPGAFMWAEAVWLEPQQPGYEGKIVILVDETSRSQSEYTAMAFRAAPDAVVVGSTTAGADGDLSQIPLPGGLITSMSGNGVFYDDKRPTQRVGIIPDIEVRPTIDGIRAGGDEVLEAALWHILGPKADEEAIRRMAMLPEGTG